MGGREWGEGQSWVGSGQAPEGEKAQDSAIRPHLRPVLQAVWSPRISLAV